MVIGVSAILLGMILIAAALTAPEPELQAASGTTLPVSSMVVPDLVSGTTAPLRDGLGEGWGAPRLGRTPLSGFGEVQVTVTAPDGRTCQLCLLAATSFDQRERGLMEVTDDELGGYDGMLFEYPAPREGAFWMRNTPMPLSIVYFDQMGMFVSSTDMVPCEDSPDCPSYPAGAPFQFAIEVPQGRLYDIGVEGEGTALRIESRQCQFAA